MTGNRAAVAFLGLPTTGKSSYIGALWQIIQDDLDTTIVEVSTAGDRSYLQELGDAVAQFRPVRRTDVDSTEGMLLDVDLEGNLRVTLDIPDMSGESVRFLVEERRWHDNLRTVLERCPSILFFVHPLQVKNALRTNLAYSLAAEIGEGPIDDLAERSEDNYPTDSDIAPGSGRTPGAVDAYADFDLRDSCTSAKIIDILENTLLLSGSSIHKIGLVISAWDLVDDRLTPRAWAERELPAVVSYLESVEDVKVTVYGVSAQGGDLTRERERLLGAGRVRERAYAMHAEGTRAALSAPINWAVSP